MKLLKILAVALIATSAYANSMIALSVQPMRGAKGSYLLNEGYDHKYQWVFNGEYGWRLGDHLALGPSVAFSWNIKRVMANEDLNLLGRKERVFMIPASFFVLIDPFPRFMIHPIAHVSLGYNSVFISNVDYQVKDNEIVKKRDGYYSGFIAKFGVDCMLDIGKTISLFAGPQWQITEVERKSNNYRTGGARPIENFNAFGFRFGVNILL